MHRVQPLYSDLKDRSVLITGGASGIGAALVAAFAAQGAKVTFLDIDRVAGEALAEKLGSGVQFMECDLSNVAALQAAVQQAGDRTGTMDIVINNAARDDRHDIDTFSEAEWDHNQAVNMKPVFFVIQAALPFLRKAGGGSIINFSSIAFLLNMGELPSYTAAKAGIIGLTKALAGRLGPENIRVNAILPGMVVTERQRQLWLTDDSIAAFQKKQCLQRTLTAEDMVGPVLFLASASSGAMTAQTMIVDGGVL